MVVIGEKVYEVSNKMAMATINIAKNKYKEENVNAIVAVQKDNIISMQKDVFDTSAALEKAITNWGHGGYTCYYVKKDEVK